MNSKEGDVTTPEDLTEGLTKEQEQPDRDGWNSPVVVNLGLNHLTLFRGGTEPYVATSSRYNDSGIDWMNPLDLTLEPINEEGYDQSQSHDGQLPYQTHGSAASRVQMSSTARDFYRDSGDRLWAGGDMATVAVPQGLSDLAGRGGDGESDDERRGTGDRRIGYVRDAEDPNDDDDEENDQGLEIEDRKGKRKVKPSMKAPRAQQKVQTTDTTTSPFMKLAENRPRDFGFFI